MFLYLKMPLYISYKMKCKLAIHGLDNNIYNEFIKI